MYIVIGGSDGLGKAIVVSLLENQYRVMNISRRTNPATNYNSLHDLSDNSSLTTAIDEIPEVKEPIEGIIISAGVFSYHALNSIDEDEYERVFSINTRAPFLMISKLMNRIKRDGTDIVIINSIAGIRSFKHQPLYNASKAAIHTFTNYLRGELSDTISRVMGIYPGMIDTNLAQNFQIIRYQKVNIRLLTRKYSRIISCVHCNYLNQLRSQI